MTAALVVDELKGGYGRTEVVHGVSLSINPGQIYAIIGKNGMGKSTLLKLMMGLLPGASGRVLVNGVEVAGDRPDQVVAQSVAYVSQDQALFQDLTVAENLRLGALRLTRPSFERRLQDVCGSFPILARRLRQRAGTLSGGEQKMLLLARALLPEPKLLLLDEVSEGVQPLIVDEMRKVLSAERIRIGLSALLVEQNLDFAFRVADKFGVLNRGSIVEEGDPAAADARQRTEAHLTI